MVVEGGEEVVWVTGRVVEQSYREGGVGRGGHTLRLH